MITGITIKDDNYLAEFLLSRDHKVQGIKSRLSLINSDRIDRLYQNPDKKCLLFYRKKIKQLNNHETNFL